MLSRIAENLFWIGRYLERAEDTCRILDVHIQQMVEDPTADEYLTALGLLSVMGIDASQAIRENRVNQKFVLAQLCYDANSANSIVSALGWARESARRARETVSVEMWEGINTTYLEATGHRFRLIRPTAALKLVRERCATISGIADQTMVHDEGWQFLRLGRSLERADMTARLVASAALNPSSDVAWSNALRACGAHHAFIRNYGGDEVDVTAAEFLLLDRLFPRSVVHSLGIALEALTELDRAEVARSTITDRASLLAGRARAELEFQTADSLLTDLAARMELVQVACRQISEAVTKRYFEVSDVAEWQGGQA